jgi:hypothetical protein
MPTKIGHFKSKTEQVIEIMNQEDHTHNEELLLWEIEKLQLAIQVYKDSVEELEAILYAKNVEGDI